MFPRIEKMNTKGNVLRERLTDEGREYVDLHLYDVNVANKKLNKGKHVDVGDVIQLDPDGKSVGIVVSVNQMQGIYTLAAVQQLLLYLSDYYIVNPTILVNRNKFPSNVEMSMFIAAFKVACYYYSPIHPAVDERNKEAYCIIYNCKSKKNKKK